MLCQFSVKNFYSYRDEAVFEFRAENLPEFQETLISGQNGCSYLPVCVLYGPNGGGKTNLIRALGCLISTVVKPIFDLRKTRVHPVVSHEVACIPYLLDEDSRAHPTQFIAYFQVGENQYRYYLALMEDTIAAESLHWKDMEKEAVNTVFEREGGEIYLGEPLEHKNISLSVNPQMPYLSFLSINYNIPVVVEVQKWFESCIIHEYNYLEIEQFPSLLDDPEMHNRMIRVLNDMGVDLIGYRIDLERKIYTQRIIEGGIFELELYQESAGIKKLFGILPFLITSLQEGRLFILDDLDAKLHPKLLRYLISLFSNSETNQKGAQLVFSSSDVSIMKNTVFRRDEIWFVVKNPQHESELYTLYDIKDSNGEPINITAAYNEQYLEGRYGVG